MHELGVAFRVIDTVKDVARENDLTQIHSVTLELGEVSTVIESYLQNCWKWAVKREGEMLEDTLLVVETIPAVTYCEDCRRTYDTVAHGKICPHCGSEHTYLIQGNEFNIKEIASVGVQRDNTVEK